MTQRIIIVDDDDSARMSAELALTMAGFSVTGMDSSREAAKAIAAADNTSTEFDLLITDLQMPGMCGLQLIKKLNAMNISIPILVITGFAGKQVIGELKLLGCHDLHEKPLDPKTLTLRVEEVLNMNMSRGSGWEKGILPPNPFRLARMETAFNALVTKYDLCE